MLKKLNWKATGIVVSIYQEFFLIEYLKNISIYHLLKLVGSHISLSWFVSLLLGVRGQYLNMTSDVIININVDFIILND
jgi:hypothetical protein